MLQIWIRSDSYFFVPLHISKLVKFGSTTKKSLEGQIHIRIFLHNLPEPRQISNFGIRLFPDKQYPAQKQGRISVQFYIRTIPSFNISAELKSCVLCSHEELLPERLMCTYCPKTYLTKQELTAHLSMVLYVQVLSRFI